MAGIEKHGKTLRIYFTYQGEKCREPTGKVDIPVNRDYLTKLCAVIQAEIDADIFDYARHFPNSRRLVDNSLGYYMDLYLEIKKGKTAKATFKGYDGMIRRYLRPKWGSRQADSIDGIEVEQWIASSDMSRLANKTIKHVMAIMRGIYKLYRSRNPGAADPSEYITIALPDDVGPDPFNRDEIRLITANGDRQPEINMITWMIWSGPRISELLGFAWEDVVDLEQGIIEIRRAKVSGHYKVTKTKSASRRVKLLAPASQALRDQWQYTGRRSPIDVKVTQRDNKTIRTEKIRPVWINTLNDKPFYDDWKIREQFWRGHLLRLDVRYRGVNQCRHTFISQMLTAGMDLEWLCARAGTSVEMIRKHYFKWMDDDAVDYESIAEQRLNLV